MQTQRQVSGGKNVKAEAGGEAEGESQEVPGWEGAMLPAPWELDVNLQGGFLSTAGC